jgi:putative pyruvate formate lyase activating enzyme
MDIKMLSSDPIYLRRYIHVMNDQLPSQFLISQSISVPFREEMDIHELLELHDTAMNSFRETFDTISSIHELLPRASSSLLDLKVAIAEKILQNCHFCERRCGIDRKKKETGYCRMDAISRYSAEFLHQGEEPELVPSHTIFLTGCNFSCVYCQNWQISTAPKRGIAILPTEIARIITLRRAYGSKNVNFVTPTPHTHTILKILNVLKVNVPVVWNSNMYYSREVARLLEGVVDVYLGDLRYGNDECARTYSNAPDYWSIITRNFKTAYKSGEILLRHLVLPGHIECCTLPIIEWTKKNIPNVRFNLMFQYSPHYRAHEFPRINRMLTKEECEKAVDILKNSGIEDILI